MDMSKKPTNILMKMFTSFIKDAEPDEIEEAMKEIAGKDETKVEIGPTTNPTEFVKETETDEDGTIEDILQRLGDIETVLAKLVKTDEEVHAESASDELEELEKELQEDEELTGEEGETEEESVTISPEELSENLAEEEAEEEEEKPMTADSKQALLNTVKAMKPIVAAIADPFERKKATDALIKSVRGQMTSNDDSYAKMNKPKKNVVAKDSAADNREDFGKKCAARNPHIKGGK